MKRVITILIALILVLSACGAPEAEVTPTPEATPNPVTPKPTPEPTPTPEPEPTPSEPPELIMSRPMPANFSLPVTDFEPESYWISEGFGYRGQALLLLSSDGRFKCWYDYYEEVPDILFGSEYALRLKSVTESGGAVSIDGDTLTLELYDDNGTAPEAFRRAEYGEALEFYRDMPLNDEVKLPLPPETTVEELAAMPGAEQLDETRWQYNGMRIMFEDDGYGGTRIDRYYTTERNTGLSVRGADIGDYIDFVKQRFPESEGDVLYGDIHGARGNFMYSDQGHATLVYADNDIMLRFIFSYGGWLMSINIFPQWD